MDPDPVTPTPGDPTPGDPPPGDPLIEADAVAAAERGAREVVARLRAAGFAALWAGGCVRDRALGQRPKDFDIATDAEPADVARLFEQVVPVGAQFGISRVLLGGGEYEIARFRAESPREDALRRDFTINGLLYDPVSDRLFDYVGGLDDLRNGRIRACGGDPEARFAEDWLRILRAVRFAARFGFTIEAQTWAAMVTSAPRVLEASPERIREELERVLILGGGARDREDGAARGFEALAALGLDALLLPELAPFERARARLACVAPGSARVGWAALAYDLPDPRTEFVDLGVRLRMPSRFGRDVGRAIAVARSLPHYASASVAQRKRLVRDETAATAFAVARAVCDAGQAPRAGLALAEADRQRWTDDDLRPPPLVDGRDLAAAGHRPGPLFKRLLDAVEDAWLEGRVADRASALALAAELVSAQHNGRDAAD